ncbi:MAG: redox-sensing transcriptional repressor Rex [Lachnospiraceae bacterium]|nr:redox-sensing transcriptional repressor Rex [Lachnospiraceae bacterium]
MHVLDGTNPSGSSLNWPRNYNHWRFIVDEGKTISQAVIGRLPRYYRYLGDLRDANIERISSSELSGLMKVTASQIRQDFNNFGGFGQQGYGYNVKYLYTEIGKILGLNDAHRLVIVGAGNLGRALIGYSNYESRGFIFEGIFDQDPDIIGKEVGELTVRPMNELEDFIISHKIDIVVIAIPKAGAVEVAEKIVKCGVKAIWNFAHTDLNVPSDVVVENVHLSDSLMKLSYMLQK